MTKKITLLLVAIVLSASIMLTGCNSTQSPTGDATPGTSATPGADGEQTNYPSATITTVTNTTRIYTWIDNKDNTGTFQITDVIVASDSQIENLKESLGIEGEGPFEAYQTYSYAVSYTDDGKLSVSGSISALTTSYKGGSIVQQYIDAMKKPLESDDQLSGDDKLMLEMVATGKVLTPEEIYSVFDTEIFTIDTVFTVSGNSINMESLTEITGKRKLVYTFTNNIIRTQETLFKDEDSSDYEISSLDEFRENGKKEKSTQYRDDGSCDVSYYDESGMPLTTENYNAKGVLIMKHEYGEYANVISVISYYDNGEKMSEEYYYDSGNTKHKILYYENGNKDEEHKYNENGTEIYFADYTEDGLPTRIEQCDDDGNTTYFAEYYENGKLYREHKYDSDLDQHLHIEYYENGNMFSEGLFDADGNQISYKKYNEDGTLKE